MARERRASRGTFGGAADAYDRHVGRFAPALADATIVALDLANSEGLLDVGCGTGKGTSRFADLLGEERVAGVDSSAQFLEVCATRLPNSDLRVASADALPFEERRFGAVVAQLLLPFLPAPVAAVREMRRVVTDDGLVAATVWDTGGGMPLLRAFWTAARAVIPDAVAAAGEDKPLPNSEPDDLKAVWEGAGLRDVAVDGLEATADYDDFDDLWSPFEEGAAASGSLTQSLSPATRRSLRDEVWRHLGSPTTGFSLTARAWCVSGRR